MLSVWEWHYTECHYAESRGTIRGLELHKFCQFKLEVVKYEAVLKKTPVKQFFLFLVFKTEISWELFPISKLSLGYS